MRVEWLQAPVPADVDPGLLRQLIAEQAAIWRRYVSHSDDQWAFPLEDTPVFADLSEELLGACFAPSERLAEALRIDFTEPAFECRRLVHLTAYRLLPPELRHDAYRSFLPEDMLRQLAMWRGYLAAVERGAYASYLELRYLYYCETVWLEQHRRLRRIARESLGLADEWLDERGLRPLAALMLQAPAPPIPQAPLWAYWQRRPWAARSGAVEDRLLYLAALQRELVELGGAWDRRAPEGHTIHLHADGSSFEEFAARTDDPDLLDLLDWLQATAERGLACYLWA